MKLNKKDFIEIEFTARIKNGDIFDSNIKEDLKKANLDIEAKPFILSLGEGMFLKGLEDFLINKEIGKYKIELKPEEAFGLRNPRFIQMMPMKIFREQKMNPFQGAMFNFDGRIAKVLTVSGGRVMVDFNNPLAGKEVIYDVNILRKIEDINEKTKSLINFLFRKDFKFNIKDNFITLDVEKPFVQFAELFKDKFKDLLDLNLEVKEAVEKTKENEI